MLVVFLVIMIIGVFVLVVVIKGMIDVLIKCRFFMLIILKYLKDFLGDWIWRYELINNKLFFELKIKNVEYFKLGLIIVVLLFLVFIL